MTCAEAEPGLQPGAPHRPPLGGRNPHFQSLPPLAQGWRGEEKREDLWPQSFSLPDGGLPTFPPGEVERGRCGLGAAGAFKLTGPYISSSQSDIGFGKLETYVKLDKLGEVRDWVWSSQGSQQDDEE